MKRIFSSTITLVAVLFFCTVNPGYSESSKQTTVEKDGQVLLPVQKQINSFGSMYSPDATSNDGWGNFIRQNGNWTVMIDKLTGTPNRAFGKPAKITGFTTIDQSNAESAALKFLNDNASTFKIDTKNIKLSRVTHANNLWYVGFSQVYNGMDVLLSKIELRIREDARVSAFYVDFYNNINVPASPSITNYQAEKSAAFGLNLDTKHDQVQSSGNLFILPVRTNNIISFKLVYDVRVDNSSAFTKYVSYVDAATGNLLWRKSLTHSAQTSVTAQGAIKKFTPVDPTEIAPFNDMYVTIGGTKYTTDKNGKVTVDITDSTAISAKFDGPKTILTCADNPQGNARFTGKAAPGVPYTLEWDDNNSTKYERTLFHAANYVRDYYNALDTASKVMDFQMPIILYWADAMNTGPNAFSAGDSIIFVDIQDPTMEISQSPSVMFHEYGHSINDRLYKSLGRTDGMVNSTCNEGTAVFFSSMMLDSPLMGLGVYRDSTWKVFRNLKNNCTYPDSITYDDHYGGQILSGAFWDLREAVSLEYATKLSHFTKYGLPDDLDVGKAFSDWFIETLLTDDDDQDLTNGTPHFNEIVTAFNRHKIGTSLLFSFGYSHTPLEDTQDTLNPYTVNFDINTQISFPVEPLNSVKLMYSVNSPDNYQSVPAVKNGVYGYKAIIPAQRKGTIVYYYITANDVFSGSQFSFSKSTTVVEPYDFLVGYKTAFYDNFETDKGWVIGVTSDNATRGIWERNVPEEANYYGYIIQPGHDYSADGQQCLVTGANGGENYINYMPDGKTTIMTPIMDISKLENPVVRFYYWFTGYSYIQGYDINFIVQITPDEYSQWITLDTISMVDQKWMKYQFRLLNYVNLSTTFRMRYILDMPNVDHSMQYWIMGKALVDDYEILTANDNAISAVDEVSVPTTGLNAFPNPFNDNVTLTFPLLNESFVQMTVFNTLGNEIVAHSSQMIANGSGSVTWNGCDYTGNRLSSGVYIIRIIAGDKTYYQKVILQ